MLTGLKKIYICEYRCIFFVWFAASDVQAELEREMAVEEGMPTVKHYQQREYAGMFEYRKEDEPLLVRNLIIGTAHTM